MTVGSSEAVVRSSPESLLMGKATMMGTTAPSSLPASQAHTGAVAVRTSRTVVRARMGIGACSILPDQRTTVEARER
jgi:hypothetical protein